VKLVAEAEERQFFGFGFEHAVGGEGAGVAGEGGEGGRFDPFGVGAGLLERVLAGEVGDWRAVGRAPGGEDAGEEAGAIGLVWGRVDGVVERVEDDGDAGLVVDREDVRGGVGALVVFQDQPAAKRPMAADLSP
jgi:hypothetical protein